MRYQVYCGVCKSENVEREGYLVTCLECGSLSRLSAIPYYLDPDFHTPELGTMKVRVVENFYHHPIRREEINND